jgi:hypothetical protein
MDNMQSNIEEPWARKIIKEFDLEELYTINRNNVTRQAVSEDENQDLIFFDASAAAIVSKVFSKFGFRRLPATVAEFEGIIGLCGFYQSLWLGDRRTILVLDDIHPAIAMVKKICPEKLGTARAYLNQDIKLLSNIHERENWMKKAATEYLNLTIELNKIIKNFKDGTDSLDAGEVIINT